MMIISGATGLAMWLSDQDPPQAPGGGRAWRPELRSLRVLIVEDELMVAWHLESMLEEAGHQVVAIAPSAEAAQAEFRRLQPDLVCMDVNLGPDRKSVV